ncbi:lanthionine synthetase C family protein [Antribacter sp. KLBMP9083]|uniref:Lanthionine synthetase C family protein n=1 Tax=Antribacter soli TaxID=2910976 RepID=A0AA41U850_9MICO|nr:lanthionine synthetase C family protein [Antribacter soli]MCF4122070.1 lanthionine synthetase C family protein [Antribacter soli]
MSALTSGVSQDVALSVVDDVAHRLSDPADVRVGSGRRRGQSLGGGAAGISLLHVERALTGHGSWDSAVAWLRRACSEDLSVGVNAGLFFGAPAVGHLLHCAQAADVVPRQAIERVDRAVVGLATARLAAAEERLAGAGRRPPLAEFDLIRGLAGLGTYLVHHVPGHDVTGNLLSYLVRLSGPHATPDDLPGWWSNTAPNGERTPEYADGHANLGLAHGAAAHLAVLAVALRSGVEAPGHRDAIRNVCSWYDLWARSDEQGTWWPGLLTLGQAQGHEPFPERRQRPSWCYGSAGIARALQLAGLALDDSDRARGAEAVLLADADDPSQVAALDGTGLCHGTAGLLLSAWRTGTEATGPALLEAASALAADVARSLDATSDLTELLDGTAGAALALHTVTVDHWEAQWDSCLLLS